MRIGQFTDSYPPIINGVSAFVAEHHAELLSQGHDPHVFTFGYTKTRDAQPNVWRTPGLPVGATHIRFNIALNGAAERAARPLDVYHSHESFIAGQQAARVSQQRRKPLIFTNHTRHDLYILNYPRLMQPFLRQQAFGRIARFIRISAVSTAPSEATAAWMTQLAPDAAERVRVVRNGIRLDQFDQAADCAPRAELGIPCEATTFVYVGRLTLEKNLSAFAGAFCQALRDGADAHWVVIGEGPMGDALIEQTQMVPGRVHFLGALPRAGVARYLAMCDVFATPSLSEVNPVSVIEALASGKPYVGLTSDWWNEFRVEPLNGSPLPGVLASDERQLSQAIHRLSADKAGRAGMSAQAKKLSHRFDIRDITAQWIEIYHAAIINNKEILHHHAK